MLQLSMDCFEVEKVRVDGTNVAVVIPFGADPDHFDDWLHVVIGWNRDARLAARRWVGAKVYTLDYYRRAARRLAEIDDFIRTTPNKSVATTMPRTAYRRKRRRY